MQGTQAPEAINFEFKLTNEALRKARLFRPSGDRPLAQVVVDFISRHRAKNGVKPISRELPIG